MVGDREVVREGKDKKKKGWFSRSKSPQKTLNIQRPPSSLNLPRQSTSSLSSSQNQDTDDLPERLSHPNTTSQSNTPDETPSRDSISAIPTHAGFDFKAIQELLEEEGAKANSKDIDPHLKEAPAPPVVPPSQRTESAPHLQAPSITPNALTPRSSASHGPRDLERSFSRSLSFNDAEDLDEQDITFEREGAHNATTSNLRHIDMNGSNSFDAATPNSASDIRVANFGVGAFEPESYVWSSDVIPASEDIGFSHLALQPGFSKNAPSLEAGDTRRSPDLFETPPPFGGADNSLPINDFWTTSDPDKKASYLSNPW